MTAFNKRGTSLALSVVAFDPTLLTVEIQPVYEHETIWGEESGTIEDNAFEMSFGNGDLGFIGIPIGDGWELTEVFLQSDFGGSATESLSFNVVDIQDVNNLQVIGTFQINASGDGQDNNAHIREVLTDAITIPDGAVLALQTNDEVGAWSSTRYGARYRRTQGNFISTICYDGTPLSEKGTNNSGGAPTLGSPANGDLVSDNYQGSGNFTPFNLQIRNTTANPVLWQAVIRGAGFENDTSDNPLFLPSNTVAGGSFDYVVVSDGLGGFDHYFTGTTPLGAFANIQMVSNAPDANGVPGTLEFYTL